MAKLKDLLTSIPAEILQQQKVYKQEQKTRREVRREAIAYTKRMDRLSEERRIFSECQQSRPSKRKVQNRFSREEAGTKGRITMGVRTGKYGVVVCSCVNKW
jgi:hypothetical protein